MRFPAAAQPPADLPDYQRLGWLMVILPFVEKTDLYRRSGPWDSEANRSAAVRFRLYTCPAAPDATTTINASYFGITGVGPDSGTLPADHPRAGVFGHDRRTTRHELVDGESNTAVSRRRPRGWPVASGRVGHSSGGRSDGPAVSRAGPPVRRPARGDPQPAASGRLGSRRACVARPGSVGGVGNHRRQGRTAGWLGRALCPTAGSPPSGTARPTGLRPGRVLAVDPRAGQLLVRPAASQRAARVAAVPADDLVRLAALLAAASPTRVAHDWRRPRSACALSLSQNSTLPWR